jgi:sporulation protein YlmC with PRC-barrel domain
MSEAAEFTIGVAVHCQDGECGQLRRVIIDPATSSITHLVVEPEHRKNRGHLVPIVLVEATGAQGVQLGATLAQFEALERAEEAEVRAEPRGDWESQLAQAQAMRGFGPLALGLGDLRVGAAAMGTERREVTEHNLPEGEGEVWRGQHVHASDGPIGHVHGLLADARGHQVSHILLGEGHLWGEKEVAIPMSAVKTVADDGVHLTLTKKEVGALPPAPGRPQ